MPTDPDGRKLVFTSADFGLAYLVERWAARFVAELFQQFDVAFVPALVPDRFPEIVDLVADLIGAIEHGDMVLGELVEKELDTLHPERALILVDRITPDAPMPWFGDLKGTLQRIAAAAPDLVGNPRYVRLLDISLKTGI